VNRGHRLSRTQKDELVARYLAGATSNRLANDFGVSVQAVCQLLERRSVPRRDRIERHRKHSLDHSAFDSWTPLSSYWAGFLFADGTIIERSGSPELALVLSEIDKGHIEKFRSFLGSTHAISVISKTNQGKNFYGAKSAQRFSVRSARLVSRLREAGINSDGERTACPELVRSRDFWRGVVDGDGWIGYGRSSRLEVVGNLELMAQFAEYVRHCCPLNGASVRSHKAIYRFSLCGRDAVAMMQILYVDAGASLLRKHNAAINVLSRAGQVRWALSSPLGGLAQEAARL
jgi:hypothetical protein